jgi:uncharacterized membrane protein YbhN (UPF0104 family)
LKNKKKKEEGALNLKSIEKIEAEIDYKKRIKRVEYILISILIGSAVVFGFIAISAILSEGVSKFLQTIGSINLFYYGIALLLIFSGYLLRFPKWEYYLKKLKVKIPRRKGFAIICVFFAFFVHKYIVISLVITAILLLPFVFLYHERPFAYLKSKLSRFESLKSFFEVGDLYFRYNKMLGRSAYWYSILYTVPSMLLNGLSMYFVILSFGINVGVANIPTILFIYSSSLIFGMITGIPANLAVTDGAMISELIAFFGSKMDFGLASVITIFFRIATIWFVELFGFIALVYTFRYWR